MNIQLILMYASHLQETCEIWLSTWAQNLTTRIVWLTESTQRYATACKWILTPAYPAVNLTCRFYFLFPGRIERDKDSSGKRASSSAAQVNCVCSVQPFSKTNIQIKNQTTNYANSVAENAANTHLFINNNAFGLMNNDHSNEMTKARVLFKHFQLKQTCIRSIWFPEFAFIVAPSLAANA